MGIVLGKPENYKPRVSMARTVNVKRTPARTANSTYKAKPRNTPKRVKDAMKEISLDYTDPEDIKEFYKKIDEGDNYKELDMDIPDELKEAMKEEGLDPSNPEDLNMFIETLEKQQGGRRGKRGGRRYRKLTSS